MTMDIHEILKRLPHRYPFLMVDRVLELEHGKRIKALKNVTDQRAVLHRPLPAPAGDARRDDARGAGAGRGAARRSTPSARSPTTRPVYYFAGIDGARFKRPVEPGDQLILDVTLERMKAGIFKFTARASVDGEIAVEAELMCTMRTRRLSERADGDDPPDRDRRARRRARRRRRASAPTASSRAHVRIGAGTTIGAALRDRGPHDDRPRQPHLPVQLDRRAPQDKKYAGEPTAARDRRPQHDPRVLHASTSARCRTPASTAHRRRQLDHGLRAHRARLPASATRPIIANNADAGRPRAARRLGRSSAA